MTINCRGTLLSLDRPAVMGIINCTPDSFYGGSRAASVDEALRKAEQMISEGAVFLDIGGQSTRPGSTSVTAAEEAARVIPVIRAILKRFPGTLVSIDTWHGEVAKAAADAGACMVNDISAGLMDENILAVAAAFHLPYVCMHMKGTPATMQQQAVYEDIMTEVLDFFIGRLEACRLAGIHDVIIDPGFGFAKTREHNFRLLHNLRAFGILEKPLLCGISRKSTIYATLGVTAAEALNGSTVLHTICLLHGAQILRVHDVKEAAEAVTLVEAYKKNSR